MGNIFSYSAITLLLLTAAAKIISAFGDSAILGRPDPLLPLTYKQVLLSAAAMELMVVLFSLTDNQKSKSYLAIAWIGLIFLIYRFCLWLFDVGGYCPCLGTVTDQLHISMAIADKILKAVVFYFLAGGIFFFGMEWRRERLLKM